MKDSKHQEAAPPWPDGADAKGWSVDEALGHCEAIADEFVDRLPGLQMVLSSEHRASISALFAFAHRANEFADAPQYESQRFESLERWEALLFAAFHGEAEHPIFIGVRETARRHDVPITELCSLLDGNRLDLAHARFGTFAEYRSYCERTAEPIGRLLLRVLGVATPQLLRYSDPLCVGLRLADDLRDIQDDLTRDRLYLPTEDLEHFGVDEATLRRGEQTDEVRALLAFEASRARSFFLRGRPLVGAAPAKVRPYFEAVLRAGMLSLRRFDE